MFNNDCLNINQEQREELNKITSRECLQAKNCELLNRYSYDNCTWLKIDGVYKTSCGHLGRKGEEYIYCPYCGKKIKAF